MGSSLDLILILRSSRDFLTVSAWSQTDSSAPGTWFSRQINVHDDREAQCNGPRARGDDHGVDGAEGIDKCRDAFLRVGQQTGQVARLHIAEDQRRPDGDGDDMDDRRDIVPQGHDAELQAHLDAALGALVDDLADQEGQNALGLVVLDDGDDIRRIVRLAQHDSHAGDIPRDQRDAQRTDDRVRDKADARFVFIGVSAFHIFQALQNFRADGGGKAGVQRLAQVLLVA